jgi:Fe-Mn family superoxide dismutase
MAFELKPPPYALDALEPHMSKQTLEFHWGAWVCGRSGAVDRVTGLRRGSAQHTSVWLNCLVSTSSTSPITTPPAGKHHRAYVDNMNKALPGSGLENKTLEEVVVASWNNGAPTPVFNNAAQVVWLLLLLALGGNSGMAPVTGACTRAGRRRGCLPLNATPRRHRITTPRCGTTPSSGRA